MFVWCLFHYLIAGRFKLIYNGKENRSSQKGKAIHLITEIVQNIIEGIELRQNLSELRRLLKTEGFSKKVAEKFCDKHTLLFSILDHEDAKTRKNAALLLGDLQIQEALQPLMDAYDREEQLFVKSSYLTAVSCLDYKELLPRLKERLDEISEMDVQAESKKHIYEEMRVISDMIVRKEGMKKHKFVGYRTPSELLLLMNPDYTQVLADSLVKEELALPSELKLSKIGVKVTTGNLNKIASNRLYREMLFIVPGMKSCEADIEKAAEKIADSGLVDFLEERHMGKAPFYFRIEVKTKMDPEKKGLFAKRLAGDIENLSGRRLINSTDHYEFELRLMETMDGRFQCYVKLFTIPDKRFIYRKEFVASSIKPVNAALLVELAKDYMVKDAQILDPFCGVGTMLIERQMKVKGNTSYGIDIFNDAILKARENTDAAGQIVHYVNKDFFEFEHEYLFDEIFTDMPFATANKPESEIATIYKDFFRKARDLMTPKGTIILYTHNREMIRKPACESGFQIVKQFVISKKQGTDLVILQN